jgi:hypothetical protein
MKIYHTLFVSILLALSTFVQAADYEEVSYEDLINQINKRKSKVIRSANDPLDQILLHAGFGLISAAHNVKTGGSDNLRHQNGFQLTLGIDLFSPSWGAETALRNFGQTRSGTEIRSLREFDLKVMNRNMISSSAGYRLGAGIGNRYFKLDDDTNNLSINDNTPTAVFFTGIDAYMQKNFSVGVEGGLRTSMITRSSDRNSVDITLRLDTYF